ncbi:class I SAM-dependent methyltransferase [Chondromyces apiculatus]|uniref:Methyltransferase type 11 domain-containing protein n=1 Tax=Chondromyces apiculatus DSM 436 TaxID=1192034 RepID=A0A017TAX9_9BACT|nr:class I SAM-dependent methyltransferase [Chondromyces apiculatus]EYF06443.1 Hypothetical protein CAP_1973 [Chondromyces apiculatus DSM 436]
MKAPPPVDFDRTAQDYARHRVGFPPSLYARLADHGVGLLGQEILDLGTGTGDLARGLARRGCSVTGVDIAPALLAAAAQLDEAAAVAVRYVEARVEALPLPAGSVDVVTAGQCWHWFDRPAALVGARRVLRPGGALVLATFDWLPLPGNVVEATEALIEHFNPTQQKPHVRFGHAAGIYPRWAQDLDEGGFLQVETFSYDHPVLYTHEGWRGRIRASQGVGASLPPDEVARFDAEHAALLRDRFPGDPLSIPHRVFVALGRMPGPSAVVASTP